MKQKKNGPRILLVENDRRVRESYEELLRYWGYTPVLAIGEGKALIRDAIARAKKYHCILALIDLRLADDFDEDEISGLQLAKAIGPIRSIILSGFPNQAILIQMLENHKDIPFLRKSDAPQKIRMVLDSEVSKVCANKRGMQIAPAELLEQIANTTFGSLIEDYPEQIADILAQLLPGAINIKIEKLDSSVTFSQAANRPRTQSVVLRVYEEDYEPVVIKLALAEKIEVEVDRYEKHIARKIGGNFIAKLERYVLLWDIGGALYSYIGDFDVKTFTRYYEEHTFDEIQVCLESFFTVSWWRHYERKQLHTNVSLFKLYNEVWGNWYIEHVKDFAIDELNRKGDLREKLGLSNPIEWLKIKIAESHEQDMSIVETTQMAVTHGNLHGDHLLVDSRRNAWVIDFERTGIGHALQDFAELEADIINRLETHSENPSSFFRMCLIVAEQTSIQQFNEIEVKNNSLGIQKALKTISTLRSLARKCTNIYDSRQYILALLFNTIYLLTINKDDNYSYKHNSLIFASILCHRLDHWKDPWPPNEWKNYLGI